VNPAAPVSAGDTIVVVIQAVVATGLNATCSDSRGNVYTTDVSSTFQASKPDAVICHANIQASLSTADSIMVRDSAGTTTCGYKHARPGIQRHRGGQSG